MKSYNEARNFGRACRSVFTVILMSAMMLALGCTKGKRTYYPEGYSGWVCVYYGIETAPPLPIEDGFVKLVVPPNGVIRTSSDLSPSDVTVRNQDYYYSSGGARRADALRHGGGFTLAAGEGSEIVAYWWVVSLHDAKADYENDVENRNPDGTPECGPWERP